MTIISFNAGTTIEGKPFVALLADGEQIGQLTPIEAQEFGIRAIQSGIEAERDAGFFKFMRTMDESPEGLGAAAAMLHGLREHRQQADPDGSDVAAEARA